MNLVEALIVGATGDWLARTHVSFDRVTAEYKIEGFSWHLYEAAATIHAWARGRQWRQPSAQHSGVAQKMIYERSVERFQKQYQAGRDQGLSGLYRGKR